LSLSIKRCRRELKFLMMGKIAVITGGSKGIGKAILEKFASEGFTVITCARNSAGLGNLKSKYKNIHFTLCDLSDKESLKKFILFVESQTKQIDILVNNTGIYIPGQVHNEEEGVLEKMINTNLYSAYGVTRGLIPNFLKQQSGHIFNICSTASIMPYIDGGSYCISKYALYGMTKVLREEMKEHGVKVTAVLPGATYTSSFEGTDLPEERFMKPEDVAEAIWGAYNLSSHAVVEELLIRPQLGDL